MIKLLFDVFCGWVFGEKQQLKYSKNYVQLSVRLRVCLATTIEHIEPLLKQIKNTLPVTAHHLRHMLQTAAAIRAAKVSAPKTATAANKPMIQTGKPLTFDVPMTMLRDVVPVDADEVAIDGA